MKVLVTGATGFIGAALCQELKAKGHEVGLLSRNKSMAQKRLPSMDYFATWQPTQEEAPTQALEAHEAIVHLAGENVAGRWTKAKKDRIFASRQLGTQNLIKGLEQCGTSRPKVLSNSYLGESKYMNLMILK